MKKLVSVTIPTFNSEKTLRKTLESVKAQTYKDTETLIIDSHSKDKTLEIAKEFNVPVYQYEDALLGARGLGVKKAKGVYILLLDSDQILEKTAVERAVKMFSEKKFDMLALYERSYQPKNMLEKLFDADRELVQKYYKQFLDPYTGVILPRFYKKEILVKVFGRIPQNIQKICAAHDHAIIYIEAYKISKKIGMLPYAVYHIEPGSWKWLFSKTYRWGYTTRDLEKDPMYRDLIKSKKRPRKFMWSSPGLSIKSNVLRFIRAIPYALGYYSRKN